MQKPNKDELIVKTRIEQVTQFNCFAATNHITGNHLFIVELSDVTIIPEFNNFKFKGVEIEVFQLKGTKELNIYLMDIELKEIFSLFIENIIEEITNSATENEAIIFISNVIQKWKRLFDKINNQGLTIVEQKGLLGELMFVKKLIVFGLKPEFVLNCWTGPDFEDKDFSFGAICFEIKFSSSKNPRIKITSERQLDTTNINKLYLSHFSTEKVKENGTSLNSIIKEIRNYISDNTAILKYFNERLELVGYYDEDLDYYHTQYAITALSNYKVTEGFPRLTINNLPSGVFNASYFIESGSIENFKVDLQSILKEL